LRQYALAKKVQSQTVNKEKLRKTLSYEKTVHKMLVKLTLGRQYLLLSDPPGPPPSTFAPVFGILQRQQQQQLQQHPLLSVAGLKQY